MLLRAGARRSSTGVPLRPGERVEDPPEGARARCARVRCGPWMDRQRTPPPDRAVSGQEPADRVAGGVFSLGDFSLDKQREVTGPQGCGTNMHGCGSVIAKKARLPNKERPSFSPLPQAEEEKQAARIPDEPAETRPTHRGASRLNVPLRSTHRAASSMQVRSSERA